MRPLLLHLRTSPIRWVFAPLLALDLAVLLLRGGHHWIGSWPATGAAAQVPAFFLSMVGAGAAAWASGAASRHRLDEQLEAAVQPLPAAEAYRLGSSVIILMSPYLVGHVVGFVLTARTFPPGIHLWFGYLAMGVVVMLMSTAWGWILGKHLGTVFAALCATLSWVIAIFLLLASRIGGLVVVSGPVWQQVDPAGVTQRVFAVLLLCVAVLWIPGLRRRPNGDWAAPLYSMAAVVAAFVYIGSTTGIVDRDPPADPLCSTGAITICLWPEDEKYLPMIQAINDRVRRLPEGYALPARLTERGLEREVYHEDGRTRTQAGGDFFIVEGSRWSVAGSVSSAIVEKTFAGCDWTGQEAAGELGPDAIGRWTEWFLAGGVERDYHTGGVPDVISRAWAIADRISSTLPPEEQTAWVSKELTTVKARYCVPR